MISSRRAVWMGRLLLAFTVWMFGCGESPPLAPAPAGDPVVVVRLGAEPELPLDLLLVLDPRTQADDPVGVAAAIGSLGEEIARSPQPVDLHVAMISSVLDAASGEPGPPGGAAGSRLCADDAFLATRLPLPWCGLPPTFRGALAEALTCLAAAPAGQVGPSQPLEAARRALGGEPGRQPSGYRPFLRDEAHLHVVLITSGDDDSRTSDGAPAPVALYEDFFALIKGSARGRLSMTVIAPLGGRAFEGPAPAPDRGCPAARPPIKTFRLAAFTESLRTADVAYFDVCRSDQWSRALRDPFGLLPTRTAACLPDGLRDSDPAQPGAQPDCVVREFGPSASGQLRRALLPACSAGPRPCFELVEDDSCAGSRTRVRIVRDCVPRATAIELVCPGP
jgi:hypothetical protein